MLDKQYQNSDVDHNFNVQRGKQNFYKNSVCIHIEQYKSEERT